MKRAIILICMLLTTVGILTAAEAEKAIDKSFNVGKSTVLEVDHRYGLLNIVPGKSNKTVTMHADITAKANTTGKAQDALKKIEFIFEEEKDRLAIRTDAPMSIQRISYEIDLHLEIPEGMTCILKNSFGNTKYEGIKGDLTLENRNGKASVIDGKNADISMAFGMLDVSSISGYCKITAANGNTNITDINGKSCYISQRFGNITGKNLSVDGDVTLIYANGNAKVEKTGSLSINGKFGNLVAAACGGFLKANIRNGNLSASEISGEAITDVAFGKTDLTGVGKKLTANNANGDIRAVDIGGSVSISGRFGDVKLLKAGGPADISCHNGNIDASDISGNILSEGSFSNMRFSQIRGKADIQTRNGDIFLNGADGAVKAENAFGDIRITDIPPFITAETSNGNIYIDALKGNKPEIELSNRFGDINCSFPENLSAVISVRTTFGKIRQPKSWHVSELNVGGRTSTMKASAGKESGSVTLETSNGNIILE